MSRGELVVPQATRDGQARAADPSHSAWVAANAGSGKTKVLVDRVLRLLLQGVAPSRILCLTYTKATAATMSNKVLAELARWARLDDTELSAILTGLERDPDRDPPARVPGSRLKAARRLFARALETPGGLKIETIHAFCTRVLQMAPFEANVPARFEVLDEEAHETMLRGARRHVITEALRQPASELGRAFERLRRDAGSDDSFATILKQTLKSRRLLQDEDGVPHPARQVTKRLARALGVPADLTPDAVGADFRATVDRLVDIDHVIAVFAQGSKTDRDIAGVFAQARAAASPAEALNHLLDGLLVQDRSKVVDRIGTKAVTAIDPAIKDQLGELAQQALEASDRLKTADALARTGALATVATAIFARYDAEKARARLLDYDDLIHRTRSLLTRVGASWVLYKLDAGIDHVLVDEAQDTTPEQWDILQALTAEFTAGHGAHPGDVTRTMFAVGDQKQSIYGFQGAAPEQFDAVRRIFARKTDEAGLRFNNIELSTSFRSVPDIVSAVDAIFTPREHWAGLTFEDNIRPQRHDTARPGGSGAVDIWDIAADDPAPESDAWNLPLDAPERQQGNMRLARRIASLIKRWSARGHDDLGQPFSPGDVLILLRNRTALFETIVRALKDAGVPVAGRDRLKLAVHPAVEDLVILGRAVLLPEDDLALATLLRTPLFDLPHEQLQALAAGRSGSLYLALREGAARDPELARAERRFAEIAALAWRTGPFAFYAHVLGPLDGRREAIHRLGAEAGDAVDFFLSAALAFEQRSGPSLFAFLEDIAGSTQDIKRDLAAAGQEVRVMTVHGAKGLESRVVILADVGVPGGAQKAEKLLGLTVPGEIDGTPVPVWSPSKSTDSRVVAAAKAEALALGREEHNRLLYVALTRAEERLIICGATKKGDVTAGSWYETVVRGLAASEAGLKEIAAEDEAGMIRRYRITTTTGKATAQPAAPARRPAPPAWLTRMAPVEHGAQPPLAPSNAIGAADRPERPLDTAGLAAAANIGKLGHLLLQVLPAVKPDRRAAAATALARARAAGIPAEARDGVVAQALALMAKPELAGLFGPTALAEVPVTGKVALGPGEEKPVAGQIDRLLIGETRVIIADFKTSARPPAGVGQIPRHMLVQMALYRALIARMFPDREIRTLLVFTVDLSVHEPDERQLAEALASLAETPTA